MNPKHVWEVALTVLGAILLLIASAGRHPYGFYMVRRMVRRMARPQRFAFVSFWFVGVAAEKLINSGKDCHPSPRTTFVRWPAVA